MDLKCTPNIYTKELFPSPSCWEVKLVGWCLWNKIKSQNTKKRKIFFKRNFKIKKNLPRIKPINEIFKKIKADFKKGKFP